MKIQDPDLPVVVLAHDRVTALFLYDSFAVVLADARTTALLTPTSSSVVLEDVRPRVRSYFEASKDVLC